MRLSAGAKKIYQILYKEKKDFSMEKSFSNLKSFHKGKLRFDFCVYRKDKEIDCLIEYDGEAHFNNIKKFYKSKKEFDNARGRDRIKNNYCLARGLKLYRIPYWEIDNINSFSDICNSKFLVISQYHNERLTPK